MHKRVREVCSSKLVLILTYTVSLFLFQAIWLRLWFDRKDARRRRLPVCPGGGRRLAARGPGFGQRSQARASGQVQQPRRATGLPHPAQRLLRLPRQTQVIELHPVAASLWLYNVRIPEQECTFACVCITVISTKPITEPPWPSTALDHISSTNWRRKAKRNYWRNKIRLDLLTIISISNIVAAVPLKRSPVHC